MASEGARSTQSLDYISPDTNPSKGWSWVRISAFTLLGLVILASPFVTVFRTETRIDAVTGSTQTQTWIAGIPFPAKVAPSPLENKLAALGVRTIRDWRVLGDVGRSVVGNVTYRACGSAPEIYDLRSSLDRFVKASTDDELRDFARIMQQGTQTQRNEVVGAGVMKCLEPASAKNSN